MRPDPVVLVVGGGPVGVAAAIMLAQRGVRATVVERHGDVYPLPRAVHLDDEVYRVLADMGVADDFAEITMPTLGLRLVDAALRPMAEFTRSDAVGVHGYPPANMFDQPELEHVLRRALEAEPLADLCSGTQMVHLAPRSDGRVDVTMRDLGDGQARVVTADAVLGCDGANSQVREFIGATHEDLKFEERWLVVDVSSARPLDTWNGVYQVCDPARAGTYMQVGPGRYRWEFRLRDGETVDSVVDSGEFECLLSRWLGSIPFDELEIIRRAEYTFRARLADRWRSGRVFLLGDAAHLTPPFIGQGLCSGLRDAANLTWKLAAVLQSGASESLLDTYESERKPHARALINKARTVGWAMTGGQGGAAQVRRVALAVACRIPGATDKVLDADPPRLVDGLTVRRDGRRDRMSGGLCPQPWLLVDGRPERLDDITGRGYAVVIVGPPDPVLTSAAGAAGIPIVRVTDVPVATRAARSATIAYDETGTLTQWLSGAGASAVLVRPDHVVQTRSTQPGAADLGRYLEQWLPQVSWPDAQALRPSSSGTSTNFVRSSNVTP